MVTPPHPGPYGQPGPYGAPGSYQQSSYQGPAPMQGMPPIIINNAASAASSAAAGGGWYPRRRRQSFWAHFWLFCFTMGIGNVLYAIHVSNWNRARGL